MDTFAKKTREELIAICKEQKIKGYSSMKKGEIIQLLLPVTLKPVDLQPLDLYANISNENFKNNDLNVLSLFSGCGGLDFGFHKNQKFNVVKSYDSMKNAVDTYNLNFDKTSEKLDVKEILKSGFELGFIPQVIIGGPPCQDFSIAGDKTIGIRANLTITYVDIICKYKPLYFIMENVPTIRTIGKSIYDIIIKKLKDESYGLSINVVYMPDYGIPQGRNRLIIIGEKNGVDGVFDSLLNNAKTPIKNIRDYIANTGFDIGLNGKEHIYRHPRNYSRRGVFSIDELYPTVRGCLRKMPPTYVFHEGDTSNDRNAIASPDWNMMAKIQTFPASYKFYDKNNAIIIGNAVPPKMSEVLANIIATHHSIKM